MKNNLIVCMTPLQALIAEKIVENSEVESYDLLYITYYNFEKNIYYYEKIKNKFKNANFIKLNKNFFAFLEFVMKSFIIYKVKYNVVYIATLHDKYCQFIAAKYKYKNLKTFDDGFGNIYPNGTFYGGEKTGLLKDIFFNKLGLGYSVEKIKKLTTEHITIYRNMKNISEKTKYISLYNKDEILLDGRGEEFSFFLGQPLYEINQKYDNDYINNLLKKINIDYYMSHPAENYLICSSVNKIKTNLVFEDYLKDFILNKNVGNIVVYSLFSSVLFNLKDIKGIKVVSIYNDELINDFSDVYEFVKFSDIEMLKVI